MITARHEGYSDSECDILRSYTSARLKTHHKFQQAYGRFEARIQIPRGQGIWPAFWMLGEDIDQKPWPACGEIDIMENIGKEPSIVHGTIHGPGYSGGQRHRFSLLLAHRTKLCRRFSYLRRGMGTRRNSLLRR